MVFKSSGRRSLIAMAVILMFLSVWLCTALTAQTATAPVVTSQPVPMVSSDWVKANMTETQIWWIKRAHNGDLIASDGQDASLYQFPADGSGVKVIVPKKPNVFGTGQWTTAGFTIDKDDNIYISNRWNGFLVKIPYDPQEKTWKFVINNSTKWGANCAPDNNGNGTWYSASDIDYVENDTTGNGNFFIGVESGFNSIFQYTGSGAGKNVVFGLANRPMRVVVDKFGNVYFTEDWSQANAVKKVFRIPRGVYGLTGAKDGVLENSWPKCGPDAIQKNGDTYKELPCQVDDGYLGTMNGATAKGMMGVSVDADGNVYLGVTDNFNPTDTNNTMAGGIFKIPVENYYDANNNLIGTMPNAAHQTLIAPVPAMGNVYVDSVGDIYSSLWAPDSSGGGGWNVTQGVVFQSFVKLHIGSAELPSAPLNQEGATTPVLFSFNSDATVGGFAFKQAGQDGVDFVKKADPQYGACAGSFTSTTDDQGRVSGRYQRCVVNLALKPQVVGSTSGVLTMQAGGNNSGTIYLHGTGKGAALSMLASPAITAFRTGIVAPKQVATDRWGNFYVADAGNGTTAGKALRYLSGATGSTAPTELGSNFTAPTGIAVDGAGNVFVADSGKIYEIPVAGGNPVVLQSGLGNNVSLGSDGAGAVYAADPDNKRVVKVNTSDAKLLSGASIVTVGTGFTAPTAVTADDSGNVFVVDGQTLTQVVPSGGQVPLTSELSLPLGVALDPSGAVYVAQADGTIRIPKIAGALDYTQKTVVGSDFTTPTSVAVGPTGTVYITDGEIPGTVAFGAAGSADFAFVTMNESATQTVTMFNIGNDSLTFGSPIFAVNGDPGPFSLAGAGDNCSTATVNPGLACNVDFTMVPTGTAGPMQAVGTIQSNAGNGNVGLTLLGVGSNSSPSKIASITYTPTAPVYPGNVTVTVTVAAASGTGIPTGKVYLTVDGQRTKPAVLDETGSAQFTLKKPNGGAHVVIASYQGDMNYASASLTLDPPLTIGRAESSTALSNPPKPEGIHDYYVLYQGGYNLQAKVTSAAGLPTGTIIFREGTTDLGTGVLDANGNATFNTNTLARGWHTVTAVYSGDSNFGVSSSTQIRFDVIDQSVEISTATPNLSLSGGVVDGATLAIAPVLGYNRKVQLACIGLPQYSECTFDNPAPDFSDGKIKPVKVQVWTNVPINVNVAANHTQPASGLWWPAGTLAIGMFGLVFGKKTKYNSRALMVICGLLIIASAVVGMSACSGNSYTKTPDAPHVTTPAGSYAVGLTATDTTTNRTVQLPFQLNVTVK